MLSSKYLLVAGMVVATVIETADTHTSCLQAFALYSRDIDFGSH